MITKIIPYLYFDGNAEEAMIFYANVFDCYDSDITRYKDMKNDVKPRKEIEDKVMHGTLRHKNFELYLSDNFKETKLEKGAQTALLLEFDSEDEIRKVYDALKEGGTVNVELHEAFWGDIYGTVTDKYGMNWELNHQIIRL